VVAAARRKDRLDTLVANIESDGGTALAVECDVTDRSQASSLVATTVDRFGRLDTLVNNAGVMLLGPIEDAPTEEWRRMIHVNVMGVLYCTRAALPHMRRQGSGHIVNVSSVGGRVTALNSGVYCLTKFGIGAFSEVLRRELMEAGIRVTLIEPGRVETELRTHTRPEVLAQMASAFARVTPLSSDEVADAIVWAVAQPPNVSVSEVLVRPAVSPL
jgi:NADP-dependent 3-hydroxy acid dehydrogenase YdfG